MLGATIGRLLVLPLLKEKLNEKAMEIASQRASLAEEEVLRLEVSGGMHVVYSLQHAVSAFLTSTGLHLPSWTILVSYICRKTKE